MANKSSGTPQKQKKQPERQCMGCNEKKPKRELLRIVRTPEGTVELDFTGRKNGRGTYICQNVSCLKKVRRSKRLERTLEVEIPDAVYAALEEELSNAN